jgi:hypothetical protein
MVIRDNHSKIISNANGVLVFTKQQPVKSCQCNDFGSDYGYRIVILKIKVWIAISQPGLPPKLTK